MVYISWFLPLPLFDFSESTTASTTKKASKRLVKSAYRTSLELQHAYRHVPPTNLRPLPNNPSYPTRLFLSLCLRISLFLPCLTLQGPLLGQNKFSCLLCRGTTVRRRDKFWWFWLYFQFLIACLSFLTFAVSTTLPQNRLQLAFTLILTNVAFKFVVNQSLPRIPYLTYLVL